MSNRFWQTAKVNFAGMTDEAIESILDEIAKIDPTLAKRLSGIDWQAISVALAKDALKATATKVNGQYGTKGSDRDGNRFLASIKRGGTEYALYQAEDGSIKASCYEYDHNHGREQKEIGQAFEAEYGVVANKAILRLLSTDGEVETAKQDDDHLIMSAEVEVH